MGGTSFAKRGSVRLAVLAVLGLLLGACHAQRAPVVVAGTGLPESPLLLMPAKVCIERQADVMRRQHAGQAGLATTTDVVQTLSFALSPERKLAAFESDSCEYAVDLGDAPVNRRELDGYVATSDLLHRLENANAKSALITEIAVRLVCAPGRGGTPGSPCYEDDVEVMLLLIDKKGSIVRAASSHVASADEARAIAHAVIPSSSLRPCRLVANDLVDCT